jgi:chemotaxis signal transduction protein
MDSRQGCEGLRASEPPFPTVPPSDQERMEAVWRERARRLAQRPVLAVAGQNTLPVLVLGIGKERYGIDLPDVAEVLPTVQPMPVPGTAAVFAGVINVQGEIRPVVDLRRLLGIETVLTGDPARVILLRKDGREMGLQIDSVEQVCWIGPGDLQSAGNGNAGTSLYVKGSTKDLLMLLSTEALFAELHTGVTT